MIAAIQIAFVGILMRLANHTKEYEEEEISAGVGIRSVMISTPPAQQRRTIKKPPT